MRKTVILILHLGYWLLYLLLLLIIFAGMNRQMGSPLPYNQSLLTQPVGILTVVPNVFIFYGFYFWVFSRFLVRRKVWQTFLSGALVCLIGSVIALTVLYLTYGKGQGVFRAWVETSGAILWLSVVGTIHGVIALVIRGFITWYEEIKVKEELTKKNFDMEMALVKARLDPHFLFNTLNNIDVLITREPERASAYLNQLSDIMRFTLYETRTEDIPLEKELDYIGKYVELQRIRSFNPKYVSFSFTGETDGARIAPMVFIPFVENAFKHADGIKTDNAIEVKVAMLDGAVHFECSNRFHPDPGNHSDYRGLGDGLIRRRLELLYPDRHELAVEKIGDIYRVKLVIRTDED